MGITEQKVNVFAVNLVTEGVVLAAVAGFEALADLRVPTSPRAKAKKGVEIEQFEKTLDAIEAKIKDLNSQL